MMLTLDTNVLYYASDTLNPDKQIIARSVLDRIVTLDCLLTTQVLGEFLALVRRKNPADLAAASALVQAWSRLLPIVGTTPDHLFAAATLAQRYRLQFWDSLIIAVARSANVDVMLTEDMQDGATIDGITLLNPFNPANRAALDALLAA